MDNGMNKNYLSWDEAFIALCKLISLRSKDKYRRNGSCIVDDKNRILSMGYNGLPFGCRDEDFPNEINESYYNSKEAYTVSSIINAILIGRRNIEGSTLYTTDFPDSDSTKMIIQNGIKKVYYIYDEFNNTDDYKASLKMLKESNIIYKQLDDIDINFNNKDLLNWDETFMGVSKVVAMRSKDPSTQVGSCIVDAKHRIISLGYNGFPFGCHDLKFPWHREAECKSETKYPYVIHAEPNAISTANSSFPIGLENSKIYVTLFPCNECAMKIIQAGIKEVIYISDKYADTDMSKAAKRMFDASNVIYRQVDDNSVIVKTKTKTINR